MTVKRYQIFINHKKYGYTYDSESGTTRLRLPGSLVFVTTQSPSAQEARADVRGLIEQATGEKLRRSPERMLFLRTVLRTLSESGLGDGRLTEEALAGALAMVNNALTEDRRLSLGISESWRRRMATANGANDASLIDPVDAANLAEIAAFGTVLHV